MVVHSPLFNYRPPRYVGMHTMECQDCNSRIRKPSKGDDVKCSCDNIVTFDRMRNASGMWSTLAAEIYQMNQRMGEEILRVLSLTAPLAYLIEIEYVNGITDHALQEMEWEVMQLVFVKRYLMLNTTLGSVNDAWNYATKTGKEYVKTHQKGCYPDGVNFVLPQEFGGAVVHTEDESNESSGH